MSVNRNQLPAPLKYFEDEGLHLSGRGQWRSTCCPLHGGNSLRVNVETGAFCCMGGCDFRGGDVIAFQMQRHGMDFVQAVRTLGAWVDDGQSEPLKPRPLSASAALKVLSFESTLAAIAACNLARGVSLSSLDRDRLLIAAGRINRIAEVFA